MAVPWPTVPHVVGFFLNRNVGRAQRFFSISGGFESDIEKKSRVGGGFRWCRSIEILDWLFPGSSGISGY